MVAIHPVAGFVEFVPLLIGGADLVWFAVALAGFLVIAAGWSIYSPIFDVLSNISIFGVKPFAFLSNLLEASMAKFAQVIMSRLTTLAHWVWMLALMVWRPLYVLVDTLTGLVEQMVGISQSSQDGLAQLRAKEQDDINTIDDAVAADVTALQNEINARFEQVAQGVDADVASLQNEMDARFSQVASGVDADVNSLQSEMDARFSQVAQGVDADVASLQNEMDARFSQVASGVDADITQLEQKITNGVSTAENFATGLVSGLGIGTIAQTLTSLQSQVSKIQTETDECLDPLCDTVTPQANRLGNLGKFFQNLEDLGLAALFIALAAECINDPAAVVHDVSTVVHEAGDVVLAGYRDLIGV